MNDQNNDTANIVNEVTSETPKKGRQGFASMDPVKQAEIASRGGKAAQAKGTAHQFTSEEAREAGRKGGLATARNREHMSRIGSLGGKARAAAKAAK